MRDAITVLGTELRAQLVRYYLHSPGPQKAAAEALGVTRTTLTTNIAALLEAKVLRSEPAADRRSEIYSVDVARLRELVAAPEEFFFGPKGSE